MCGINGIAYTKNSGKTVDTRTLTGMRDVLVHRGPDEEGIFIDRNVGFGHRRLLRPHGRRRPDGKLGQAATAITR